MIRITKVNDGIIFTVCTGRAKVLLCYQAPLERKTHADGTITFSILKSFS